MFLCLHILNIDVMINLRQVVIFVFILFVSSANAQKKESISLDGNWRFLLDGNFKDWPQNRGVEDKWYTSELPTNESVDLLNKIYFKNGDFVTDDYIYLPGTTDESQIGVPLQESKVFTPGLERLFTYDGAFWVQRTVQIPKAWNGKTVVLFMERLLGGSKVYWDGQFVGEDYGYACPHEVVIDKNIQEGQHVLTILLNKGDYRYSSTGHHEYSANGASWNGIVGRLELVAKSEISYLDNVQIYPDIKDKSIQVRAFLNEMIDKNGCIRFSLRNDSKEHFQLLAEVAVNDSLVTKLSIPEPVLYWNEFTPNLYELKTELIKNGQVLDVCVETFGMREIGTSDGYITLNNEKIFMRGTLDCGSYPVSGYPFMKKDEWLRIMKICKSYGLNHIRFHTWCPPEAAFEAADEIGMYLQPELTGAPYAEIDKVLKVYGNHPSFCTLSLNNERTHDDLTRKVISDARNKDKRHLYTCTTQPVKPDCVDDFYISAWGNRKIDEWPGFQRIVGITWGGGDVVHSSRFNLETPGTTFDYSKELEGINAPIISHEIGQWAMFPRLDEISKYSGVLRNTNYERIKNAIAARGMLHQADDLADASGSFSAILYKEEIESALRTPNFAGFQLLDLHDYQGQYISIVGILDAFWDSKNLVSPRKHSQYCNAIVPLVKMEKRVWSNSEFFNGELVVANYSVETLKNSKPYWTLLDSKGNVLQKGSFTRKNIIKGGLTSFGSFSLALHKVEQASKLTLKVAIANTAWENSWDIWVYPEEQKVIQGKVHVLTAENLSKVQQLLDEGENVLLTLKKDDLRQFREGCFTTIFWNSIHKWPQRAHTMGVLCDPEHAVFKDFPTEIHSNWQWWDIAMNANAMSVSSLPHCLSPLIQVVDSYIINDKLAYLWECCVGKGKLLVTSIDLETNLDNRPATKQLKCSIFNYMNSEGFNPAVKLNWEDVKSILK